MDTIEFQSLKPAHVLLVEDEEIIRILLAEELSSHGLAVTQAASADEAWDMLEAGAAIDLVVSDAAMPGSMNGMELLHRVRGVFPHIKRVLISANPGPDNVAELAPFLQKPFRLEAVARMALGVLGISRG